MGLMDRLSNNLGAGPGGGGLNQGRLSIDLKPRAERTRSVDQIIAEFHATISALGGQYKA